MVLKSHLGCMRVGRFCEHIIRKAAQKRPRQLMYIEGDRQNSVTTAMPFMARPIKNKEHIFRINLTLHGFLVNGISFHSFLNLPNHRKDNNNSLTSRWNVLQKYCAENEGLPPVLVFQTDSSAAENKSKLILKWHCWLVMCQKCKAINLIFPWVGHSHGGVDAVFGRFSSALRREKEILDYQTLIKVRDVISLFQNCFCDLYR